MNWRQPFLEIAARLVRRPAPAASSASPRLLVIRRNRLGDMICTLPLLHALRGRFPHAHLAVACDPPGAPIAAAAGVVDDVIVLASGGAFSLFANARRLQGFDWVVMAKGGFDRRQATLARLGNGARRVGFDEPASIYYTDPVPLPDAPAEHQIETQLRLLAPLGIVPAPVIDLPPLEIPASAGEFARGFLARPEWKNISRFVLINISSTARLKFRPKDFVLLAQRMLVADANAAVLFVAAPADQSQARELALGCNSKRIAAIATPGPLELAALMRRAALIVTPEGGAAHLAAATGLAALVIWSEGPFEKWRSRAQNHVFVQAAAGEPLVPVERVWQALEPLLRPTTGT
jgi:ADP-heptose:LPS heptosyltransferase